MGVLLVDCRGTGVVPQDVEVEGLTMLGETDEASPPRSENGVARFDLWPGSYTAVWYEEESDAWRRVGVRIRAGETTRVRVTDPRRPDEEPIAPGFGRLRVTVYGLSGRPLPAAQVAVSCRAVSGIEERELETDGRGTVYSDVRPGPYRVAVGAQAQRVDVPEGGPAHVVVRYVDEGEVEIRSPLAGIPSLREPGGLDPQTGAAAFRMEPGRMMLRYVRPGSYDLFLQGTSEQQPRRLERVSVFPLRRTVFSAQLPAGGIDVTLEPTNGQPAVLNTTAVRATLLGARDPPGVVWHIPRAGSADGDRDTRRTRFRWLPAGRWRVAYKANGFRPVQTEVIVGTEIARVTLRLERAP